MTGNRHHMYVLTWRILLAARVQLGGPEMYCAGCRGHVIRRLRSAFLWVLVSGRKQGSSRGLDSRREDRWRVPGTAERPSRAAILHKHPASSAIFFQKAGGDWTGVWLRVLSAVERTAIGRGCWDGVPRRANRGPCRTSGATMTWDGKGREQGTEGNFV